MVLFLLKRIYCNLTGWNRGSQRMRQRPDTSFEGAEIVHIAHGVMVGQRKYGAFAVKAAVRPVNGRR